LRVLQRLQDGQEIAAVIARQSIVGPAAMQGVLDGLVDRGFVLRQRSQVDRRKQLLQLTPEGEEALAMGNRSIGQAVNELVESLKETEQAQVVEGLNRIQEALERTQAMGAALPTSN
jgi:DNA-binding MarR family transcriptional regulator